MLISDKKILELIDLLKASGKIRYKKDFYDEIGILKQNVYWIKNQGKSKRQNHHFTAEHIIKICHTYNVNANWIVGTENKVFLTSKNATNKEFNHTFMPTTKQKEKYNMKS